MAIPGLFFFYFRLFKTTQSTGIKCSIKIYQCLDSNRGPLVFGSDRSANWATTTVQIVKHGTLWRSRQETSMLSDTCQTTWGWTNDTVRRLPKYFFQRQSINLIQFWAFSCGLKATWPDFGIKRGPICTKNTKK